MIMRSEIEEVFSPLLKMISKSELRSKVLDVWESIGKEAKWSSLKDAKFGLPAPNTKLVDHIFAVTNISISIAKIREETYGISPDWDLLVTAGLLHDVGKILEYYPGSDGVLQSTGSEVKTKHWFIGAHWAICHGLPDEIVNIIMNHTNQNNLSIKSYEGRLLYLADLVDADFVREEAGSPLLTAALKKTSHPGG